MSERGDARAIVRTREGKIVASAGAAAIRTVIDSGEGIVWVDLLIKSEADGHILSDVFGFHPLTIEDCVSPRVDAAKIDDYESYLFLVVQALTHYQPYAELEAVEVDFYLGSNYVVSCHQQPVPAIELFREHCLRDDNVLNHTADWVLHGLLDALVDEYLPIVDAVDDTIDDLETQILHRAETTQLQQLLLIKRNALRLRRATIPQRDIMNRLSRGEFSALIRPEMGIYFRDIYDHLVRIEYLVDALRDLADGALQTYLSVVSNRLNEVMKLLTAAATIFLPLTLISGVYGMNFEENQFPSFSAPWGFAAVVGSMLAIAIGLLVFFRLRRWV